MTGSNKILTVSYGTFSCTLEGFDDPFGTMRGIAEYFRDLAADDRYFGAEPPTPDAEMLQNIAQKEVRQRVEARVGDNGVALRQVAKDEPKSEQASVEDAETLESGPLAFDDEYLLADEPEDVLTVDVSAEPIEEDAPVESVAEKLLRSRAVVSRNIEPQTAEAGEQPNQTDAPSDESAPRKRSRALTQTINSITADLADDDEDEYADEQFSSGILDDVDEADEQAQFEQADETDRVISNIVSEDSSADEAEEEVESPIEPETNVEEEDTFEEELSAAIADASEDQPEETDDLVSEDQASDGAAEEVDADDDDVA
ncbi:MAG: hypothetical protein OXQ92_00350, partial [Boseongicola sp.]|nr:hypothetical protein [Boseongicola sp.]